MKRLAMLPLLPLVLLMACSTSDRLICDNPEYELRYDEAGIDRYVFSNYIPTYEDFASKYESSFPPSRESILESDSLLLRDSRNPIFIQYGGFATTDNDSMVVVNMIYERDDDDDYGCSWIWGLGPFYERSIKEYIFEL